MERNNRQLGSKLQTEESEVTRLKDTVERLKTDNIALKRIVDKQALVIDNIQKSIGDFEKRISSLETP